MGSGNLNFNINLNYAEYLKILRKMQINAFLGTHDDFDELESILNLCKIDLPDDEEDE